MSQKPSHLALSVPQPSCLIPFFLTKQYIHAIPHRQPWLHGAYLQSLVSSCLVCRRWRVVAWCSLVAGVLSAAVSWANDAAIEVQLRKSVLMEPSLGEIAPQHGCSKAPCVYKVLISLQGIVNYACEGCQGSPQTVHVHGSVVDGSELRPSCDTVEETGTTSLIVRCCGFYFL